MKANKIIAAAVSALLAAATVPMLVYAETADDTSAETAETAETTTASSEETADTAETTEPGSTDEPTDPPEATDPTETTEPETEPSTEPEPVIYTITFLGFEGEEIAVLNVEEGQEIDYSLVDTSVLHKHLSVDTERDFYAWDPMPVFATEDTTIHALSRTAVISHEGTPEKTLYNTKVGSIDISGLRVFITMYTQTPAKDEDGNYTVTDNTIEITGTCFTKPASLDEAFADGDSAKITVYPIGDDKAILSYTINYERGLGDVDSNGLIDGVDAAAILKYNADLTAGNAEEISAEEAVYWDVSDDGIIDPTDASMILKYAADFAAGENVTWESIRGK